MPLLKIRTNMEIEVEARQPLMQLASARLAELLGKSESYVMVSLESGAEMLLGGSDAPLAYLELKSIGLPADRTKELSAGLCGLMTEELSIDKARVYIEFSDAARHLWGWNGTTFER